MNVVVNPDMRPGTMRVLQDIMHRVDSSVGLFEMLNNH